MIFLLSQGEEGLTEGERNTIRRRTRRILTTRLASCKCESTATRLIGSHDFFTNPRGPSGLRPERAYPTTNRSTYKFC